MIRVLKYAMPPDSWQSPGTIELPIPKSARILCVQVQRNVPCLWALVDDSETTSRRVFRIIGTGHEIASVARLRYVGTFQLLKGDFVGHVFEEKA